MESESVPEPVDQRLPHPRAEAYVEDVHQGGDDRMVVGAIYELSF